MANNPFTVTSRIPGGPLTPPAAPTLPTQRGQLRTDAVESPQAQIETLAQALQDDTIASANDLDLYAEDVQDLDELNFQHQETGADAIQIEAAQQASQLLGGMEALESLHKMARHVLANLIRQSVLSDTDFVGEAGQVRLRRIWPQPPLQCYLALQEALTLALVEHGADSPEAARLQMLLDGLLGSAGPDLLRSLRALASYTQYPTALPTDEVEPMPGVSALELLRSQRGDGVTLVQLLDILQQKIGYRLHKALRTSTAEKEESIARLVGTMRLAQLVVLIRTALDAARDLIAACDHYQTPLAVHNQVLAEHLLELLEDAPGKKHLQSLAEQLVSPRSAKYGLFFTELSHTLRQRFALAAWRSITDRAQLLSLLEQLSGAPERAPAAGRSRPGAPVA
jgi:hypothetical protein